MKKAKKITFVVIAIFLAIYLIYGAYERWFAGNWKEYEELVKVWPSLKNENIESVRFTSAFSCENKKYLKNLDISSEFRLVAANIVEEWPYGCEIPKENLPEFIEIMDKAVKRRGGGTSTDPFGDKMLIVTDKGKYIFRINPDISEVAETAVVYGGDWGSCELGKLIARHCCPDIEYKYDLPPKEKVVAILVYLPIYSPPLALFGDKKLAEKIVFETRFPDNPKGIQGLGEIVRGEWLLKFGVKSKLVGNRVVATTELNPKMTFDGRVWLGMIMDAYEAALKEAKEKDKYYPGMPDSFNARLVFMTENGDCWKELGIDANSVFDDYIRSKQLKAYFNELGLTKELLAEEPNAVGG